MLKNTSKGQRLENLSSLKFHQTGVPLLISPVILRSRGLGQIDLARFLKNSEIVIEICEMKSSKLGVEGMSLQRQRLQGTNEFLRAIFGLQVKLIVKVG